MMGTPGQIEMLLFLKWKEVNAVANRYNILQILMHDYFISD